MTDGVLEEGNEGSSHRVEMASALLSLTYGVTSLVFLLYLILSYAPIQIALLAELGVTVPHTTRLTIEVVNWVVRLFPLLAMVAPGGMVLFWALGRQAIRRAANRFSVSTLLLWACLLVAFGLASSLASAVIVHSLQTPVKQFIDNHA